MLGLGSLTKKDLINKIEIVQMVQEMLKELDWDSPIK